MRQTLFSDIRDYAMLANRIRRRILSLLHERKSPHIGPSFSTVEILVSLYFKYLRVYPDEPLNPQRDRLIFSKGHACPALYAVLNARGFISDREMNGFAIDRGSLEQHPTRNPRIGIELSTGSLGHGLSVGAGMAVAAKRDKKDYRVYVLLGDGELNEGSVWEAAMFASHYRLDNLVSIIDRNRMQALGYSEDIISMGRLGERWSSFGWRAQEVDGHDFGEIFTALESSLLSAAKPSVIIANTTKGKGVSFMENQLLWHYRAPSDEEYRLALEELTI